MSPSDLNQQHSIVSSAPRATVLDSDAHSRVQAWVFAMDSAGQTSLSLCQVPAGLPEAADVSRLLAIDSATVPGFAAEEDVPVSAIVWSWLSLDANEGSGSTQKQEAPPAESAALDNYPDAALDKQLDTLFRIAGEENFEDGIETDFSRHLMAVVQRHGKHAIESIHYLLGKGDVHDAVASEALRWLGRIQDPPTHGWRRWVLCITLNSRSIRVRDGAVLGLASMDDPKAIDSVQQAMACEPSPELLEDLHQLLTQLQETAKCQSS